MKTPAHLDGSQMLEKVRSLPRQLLAGFDLGCAAWANLEPAKPAALVVAGMGASAIGGDLLRLHLAGRSDVPVEVFRDYGLPGIVSRDSLIVISSYSGNTDEALACFSDAIRIGARTVCVTSGGRVREEARRQGIPIAVIPSGLPPRAGLGYSFAVLLALALKVGLCEHPGRDLEECATTLEGLNATYSAGGNDPNPAARLADQLVERVPIIYCSNHLDAVGLRWKNQFCENSKGPAFVSFVPEANHNDVMGWELPDSGMRAGVVVLRTAEEHPKVARMLSLVGQVIGDRAHFCGEFRGQGSSLLSRVFSLILLGDYASVYLALRRGVDPTPIRTIEEIKDRLGRGRAE
jgi:glucose/mannose-6-phosphate isomerase